MHTLLALALNDGSHPYASYCTCRTAEALGLPTRRHRMAESGVFSNKVFILGSRVTKH